MNFFLQLSIRLDCQAALPQRAGPFRFARFGCSLAGVEVKQLSVGRIELCGIRGDAPLQLLELLMSDPFSAEKPRQRFICDGAEEKDFQIVRRSFRRLIHER